MPWKEVVGKLNEFGIGKFDFEETDDKVTFTFNGKPLCHYDKGGETPIYFFDKSGKIFFGWVKPARLEDIQHIMTMILCGAILIYLFGEIAADRRLISAEGDNVVVFSMHEPYAFFIKIPAFNLTTNIDAYRMEFLCLYRDDEDSLISLQLRLKDLTFMRAAFTMTQI